MEKLAPPIETIASVAESLGITSDAVRLNLRKNRRAAGNTDSLHKSPATQAELLSLRQGDDSASYVNGPVVCGKITYATHAECAIFSGVPWDLYGQFLSEGRHPNSFIWPSETFDPIHPITVDGVEYTSLFVCAHKNNVPVHLLYWLADRGLLTQKRIVEMQSVGQSFNEMADGDIQFPTAPIPPNSLRGQYDYRGHSEMTLKALCTHLQVPILAVAQAHFKTQDLTAALDLVLRRPQP